MITRTHLFSVGFAAAVLTAITLGFTPAQAIEGESIVLSPASARIQVGAGETVKDTIKVINDGTTSYDFSVYSSPYSVANGTYEPNYTEKKSNADLYTWVTYDKKSYSLNPGESVDVPYTITVPADAAPGGHYGVLFAETEVPAEGSGQIARKKRVGAIVYATVKGDYITAGKQLDAKIDWLQLGGPITATLSVENTGNTDFTMTELMQVKNVLGGTVYEKTNDRTLLPKTTRDINLAWTGGPIMGLYNVKVESKILDKVTTKQSWVLLMPMWVLVLSVLAIVGIIYWLFRRRR
jgi:hypothetical protein